MGLQQNLGANAVGVGIDRLRPLVVEVLPDLEVHLTRQLEELRGVEARGDRGVVLDETRGDPPAVRYLGIELLDLGLQLRDELCRMLRQALPAVGTADVLPERHSSYLDEQLGNALARAGTGPYDGDTEAAGEPLEVDLDLITSRLVKEVHAEDDLIGDLQHLQ